MISKSHSGILKSSKLPSYTQKKNSCSTSERCSSPSSTTSLPPKERPPGREIVYCFTPSLADYTEYDETATKMMPPTESVSQKISNQAKITDALSGMKKVVNMNYGEMFEAARGPMIDATTTAQLKEDEVSDQEYKKSEDFSSFDRLKEEDMLLDVGVRDTAFSRSAWPLWEKGTLCVTRRARLETAGYDDLLIIPLSVLTKLFMFNFNECDCSRRMDRRNRRISSLILVQ
ncbi:hypothetical protein IQ07DRAFT_601190 [Pyrenochaeta sp. DS3sAY3a]|nr:hypothetical protein IQ07DRAFT_601190 [Pyrenochaeta sp. DS3sAY3a]